MNIAGLNKAEVLVALYNRAKIQGRGFYSYNPNFIMNRETAEKLLATKKSFDYLNGKVLKINLDGDELDTWLYNRDNGADAAEEALEALVHGMESSFAMSLMR